MQYAKRPLSFDQQADLLIARGMIGERALMIDRLRVVNYYRLSAYWYPFRESDPANTGNLLDTFRPGTSFQAVWNRYVFDRRLRLMVIDALERVEVAVRTLLSYHHAHRCGNAFAYAEDATALPCLSVDERNDLVDQVKDEVDRSRETFVEHFRSKYGDSHKSMPFWMATEIMTFGCVLRFFRGVSPDVRKEIARAFAVHEPVLHSWLLSLNTIRNICAHHGRLWNREMGLKPKIPNKDPRWKSPVTVGNSRIFGILTILKHCLDKIAPQSRWPERLRGLLAEFPDIPIRSMGFPSNWTDCPIWAGQEDRGSGG